MPDAKAPPSRKTDILDAIDRARLVALTDGMDPLFPLLRAAWIASDTQVERDTVQACIAALRLEEAIEDTVVPIENAGTAFPRGI